MTLRQLGFEVAVLEKRSLDFNRFNMVNLKVESEVVLKDLEIFEDFEKEVASRLQDHRILLLEEGSVTEIDSEDVSKVTSMRQIPFTSESLKNPDLKLFGPSGVYTVIIGEYQQFLAKKARQRGVKVIGNTEVAIEGGDRRVLRANQNGVERLLHPDLVVLSDGARGGVGDSNARDIPEHHCHNERWIFGNVAYSGERAFVTTLIEFSQEGRPYVSNVIFNPKARQANVAFGGDLSELNEDEVKTAIERAAQKAFDQSGVDEVARATVVNTQIVDVVNQQAEQVVLGNNVVLAGDRAGVSSPLAGLGATLASTYYPAAVRELGITLGMGAGPEVLTRSLNHYREDTASFTKKWLDTSHGVKAFILNLNKKK